MCDDGGGGVVVIRRDARQGKAVSALADGPTQFLTNNNKNKLDKAAEKLVVYCMWA